MISIFQKEATGVEFHSSSHKVTFLFYSEHLNQPKLKVQVNIIIINRDFPKVVFKKKRVLLDSYIKEDIDSG